MAAEKEKKPKGEKPEKAEGAEKAPRAEKAPKEKKAKAEAAEAAPAPAEGGAGEKAAKPARAEKAPKAPKGEAAAVAEKAAEKAAEGGLPVAAGAGKPEKPARPEKGPKPGEKGEKAPKGEKKAKAEAAEGAAPAAAAEKAPEEKLAPPPPPRLWERYRNEIVPRLKESLGYKNAMAVPKLEKIVISMGVGAALQNPKRLEEAQKHLTQLAGQKAVVTKARVSIANFRLRQGNAVGCKVTLRRARMYEFLDRLISVAIPRIRDFRGLSPKAFDGRGNYSMGLTEQVVFPEIEADKIEFTQGMNIAVCTTAKSDKEAYELLNGFGFPFRQA